jgi:hypothetical protein
MVKVEQRQHVAYNINNMLEFVQSSTFSCRVFFLVKSSFLVARLHYMHRNGRYGTVQVVSLSTIYHSKIVWEKSGYVLCRPCSTQ